MASGDPARHERPAGRARLQPAPARAGGGCAEPSERPARALPFRPGPSSTASSPRKVGPQAALALLAEVTRGAYRLESFEAADVAAAHDVIETYGDLDVGLADASIVVLAHRHETRDVLTLDQRRFRTLRERGGRPFRILPADGG